jgi:hypothetical protein
MSVLDQERNVETLAELPFYYQEISKPILEADQENKLISDCLKIRSHLYDIQVCRLKKLRDGVSRQANKDVIMVQNVGSMEINYIRPLLINAMLEINKLENV